LRGNSLGMKAMRRALNFCKPADGNGWGMSAWFLGYKLDEQGKKLNKNRRMAPIQQNALRLRREKGRAAFAGAGACLRLRQYLG
jgi:hypothetical protein